jgi:hypothetical protein
MSAPTAPTGCRGTRAANAPSARPQTDPASQPTRLTCLPHPTSPCLHEAASRQINPSDATSNDTARQRSPRRSAGTRAGARRLRLLSVTVSPSAYVPRYQSSRLPTDYVGMAKAPHPPMTLDPVRGMSEHCRCRPTMHIHALRPIRLCLGSERCGIARARTLPPFGAWPLTAGDLCPHPASVPRWNVRCRSRRFARCGERATRPSAWPRCRSGGRPVAYSGRHRGSDGRGGYSEHLRSRQVREGSRKDLSRLAPAWGPDRTGLPGILASLQVRVWLSARLPTLLC